MGVVGPGDFSQILPWLRISSSMFSSDSKLYSVKRVSIDFQFNNLNV